MKVKLTQAIILNGQRHNAGETVEMTKKDLDAFVTPITNDEIKEEPKPQKPKEPKETKSKSKKKG